MRVRRRGRVFLVLLLPLFAGGCAASGNGLASGGTGGEPGADMARQRQVAHDPDALMRIARAASAADDPAGAAAFYARAAELRPDSVPAEIGYGRALARQGRLDEAVAALDAARRRAPADPALAAALGRLQIAAGRPEEALASFADGLRAHSADPALLIGSGVAEDALGRHAAAQDAYRRALAAAPGNVAARNDLAFSLALSGDCGRSLAMLRALAAEASGPDAAAVRGNLALVYAMSGDVPAAAQTARGAMSPADAENNLRFYALLGRREAAQDGGAASGDGPPGAAAGGGGPPP